MKIKLIILLSAFSVLPIKGIYAQVGINTLNPQNGALHIDASGNNAATGTPLQLETSDDLLIDNNGRVSIGHITPTSQLHIISSGTSAIKIEDGTQNTYKGILTSDANGYGTWKNSNMVCVKGVLTTGLSKKMSEMVPFTTYYDTGAYITLSPGRWVVYVSMLLYITGVTSPTTNQIAWVRSTFRDDANSATDINGGTLISGVSYTQGFGLLDGFIVIDNSTNAAKKYTYKVGYIEMYSTPTTAVIQNFASSEYTENYIMAIKMKDL